jgi:hypothetical protein
MPHKNHKNPKKAWDLNQEAINKPQKKCYGKININDILNDDPAEIANKLDTFLLM